MAQTTIKREQIRAGAITNTEINASAGISLTKLQNGSLLLLSDGSVSLTGNLNANNQKIINLLDPTNANDGVNKQYVDALVSGLKGKQSVKAGSTANLTLSGAQTVDGIALVAGDRVLVKDQTVPAQNGIYLVASGSWTRSTDADSWTELVSALVLVEEGTVNADKAYLSTVNQGGTLNTTAVTFVAFGSFGGLVVGNFVKRETPSGAMDGTNASFALAFTPITGTEEVFLNGILQVLGGSNDYTISGSTITIVTPPVASDVLRVSYIK